LPNVPPGTGFSKANRSCCGSTRHPPGTGDGRSAEEPVPRSEVTEVDGAAAAHRLMEQTVTLLKWALVFFLVSIVAGVLGFTGISAASADVARFLFYVFVVIFLVLLVLGLTIFRV
jgi:uncharacterized membrane protein YtjA (UPF0391 family)